MKARFQKAYRFVRRPRGETTLPLFLFLGSAFALFYWNVQFISEIQTGALAVNQAGVQVWERMIEQDLEQQTLELSYAALLDPEVIASLRSADSSLALSDGYFERHPIVDKLFLINDVSIVIAESETIFDGGEFESLRSLLERAAGPGALVSQAFLHDGRYYQAIAVQDLTIESASTARGHGLLVDLEWVETELLPGIQRQRELDMAGGVIESVHLVTPATEDLAAFSGSSPTRDDPNPSRFPDVELEISDAAISDGMFALRGALIFQAIVSALFLSVMVLMGIHLMRTRRALEMAERRNAIVGSTSHALRTPLTIISLYAETLTTSTNLNESDKECSDVIARESGRLLHQLEDGLNFARIAAGKQAYQMGPADLNDVVEASLSGYEQHLKESGYRLSVSITQDALPIQADIPAIALALENVLQNAIKYGRHSKYLGVATYREENSAVVEITDHGVGIPLGDQAHIFEEFHRASTASTERGWGLGLYIVKHVVDGHGARIEVDSEVGWGTQVRIYFPMVEGENRREGSPDTMARADSAPTGSHRQAAERPLEEVVGR